MGRQSVSQLAVEKSLLLSGCITYLLITARHSYVSTILGVVILSICLSHACFVTKPKKHCRYFDTTRKGNHSSFLTPTAVGGQRPLLSEICAKNDPPFEIADYNTCVVRSLCHS